MKLMKELLRTALFTPIRRGWGLCLGFEGDPGIGKSDVIEGTCGEWGIPCETLSPGERGEGAFGVVPVPEGGMLTYPPPEWITKFSESKGRGLIFVDELTTADRALQPPLLGLTLAKRIGAVYLGDGVRTMCAFNPPGSAAAGYDLNQAQANRLCHIKWDAGTPVEWGDWLSNDDGLSAFRDKEEHRTPLDPAAEEKRVLAAWPEPYAKAKGYVIAFVERRPDLLHKKPEDNSPAASGAWPSRRTWEFATRALASSTVHGVSDECRYALVAGYVGQGAAREFFDSVYKESLPDPAKLLDGKDEFEHDSRRPDRTHAVLSSCASLVLPEKSAHREKRTRKLWELLTKIVDKDAKALVVVTAQRLATARLIGYVEARPVLLALDTVLADASELAKKAKN